MNHAKACYNLAVKYQNEDGVEKAPLKAANLYIKACDLGNASACYNLGIMYSDGKFFAKNSANAKEYFRRACDMNFDEACKAYNNLNK